MSKKILSSIESDSKKYYFKEKDEFLTRVKNKALKRITKKVLTTMAGRLIPFIFHSSFEGIYEKMEITIIGKGGSAQLYMEACQGGCSIHVTYRRFIKFPLNVVVKAIKGDCMLDEDDLSKENLKELAIWVDREPVDV